MAVGKTPVNQLNALPLLDADQAGSPGQVTILGNTMTRFWSPAALGVNGNFVADPLDAGGSMMLSNYLDVRGSRNFQLVLVRTAAAVGGDVAESVAVLMQYKVGGLEQRTGTGAAGGTSLCTQLCLFTWSIYGGPYPQSISATKGLAWANDSAGGASGTGPNAAVCMVGYDVRLWFRRTVGINANQTYAAYLWASQ